MNKFSVLSLLLLATGIFYLPRVCYIVLVCVMLIVLVFLGKKSELKGVLKDLLIFLLMFSPFLMISLFFSREGRIYHVGFFTLYGEGITKFLVRVYHLVILYLLSSIWFKIFPMNFDKEGEVAFLESLFLSIKWFPLFVEKIHFKRKQRVFERNFLKNGFSWIDKIYVQLINGWNFTKNMKR